MHVLVIGGTAFMGPYVVRQLVAQGHDVTVYHRGQTDAQLPPSVRHIRNPQSRFPISEFPPELHEIRADVVLHMIAMTERDALLAMDTFRAVARRIVVASSADVYRSFGRLLGAEPGPPEAMPLHENSPLRDKRYPYRAPDQSDEPPQSWRDEYDKILVEQVILSDPALPGTILRLPMVYGPGDKQHRLFSYLKRMDDQRPAILLDEITARWQNTRGYVENVAAAIALAVTNARAAGQIYNVAEQEALEEAAWVRRIGEAAGWNGKVVSVPAEQLPPHLAGGADMRHHLVLDSTRIRQELGYREIVPLDEALRRTVAWERANHPDQIDPAAFDYAAEDAALSRHAA